MTLPEHSSRIDRLVSQGIDVDESRFDEEYKWSLLNTGRAFVLRQDFIKFRRWSPAAIQTFYPGYDINFQDSVCYTRFTLPTGFIQANSTQDGLVYCGSSSEKIMTTRNFRRVKTRNELADFLKNDKTTPANGRYVAFLLEGLLMTIISKDRIKQPMITGVFDAPHLLPDYNIPKDNWPIAYDMIQPMETYIMQTAMGIEGAKPADNISDSKETYDKIGVRR